jgi:hypothetical protein
MDEIFRKKNRMDRLQISSTGMIDSRNFLQRNYSSMRPKLKYKFQYFSITLISSSLHRSEHTFFLIFFFV